MIYSAFQRLLKRITTSRLLRDSSVMFVGNIASTGFSLLASIIIGRILGDNNYGLIVLAITAIETVVQFMDVRTTEGLIKFMGEALALERPRDAITYFYIALGIDGLLMVATLVVARFVSPLLVAPNEQAAAIQQFVSIYLFTIPFTTLESTFSAVLITYKRYHLYTFKVILRSLVLVFCLGLLAGYTMTALVWGYVVVAGFGFGVSAILAIGMLARRIGNLRGQNYRRAFRRFLPFAFHTSLMSSLKAVSTNLNILLLGALRPASEAAFYRIARNATHLMTLPIAPMATVIYPAINEAWAKENTSRIKYLIGQFIRYSAVISLSLAIFLIVAADWLVHLTYGADYAPMANVIRLLSAGVVVGNIAHWMRPTIMASGNPQLVTFTGVISLAAHLLVLIPLTWYFGANGAAVAYIASTTVAVIVNVVYALPKIGLWKRLDERT